MLDWGGHEGVGQMSGTIAVFSASGRPGLAQVRQLKRSGTRIRAITRQTHLHPTLADVDIVAADLNDESSLVHACTGADVVFFTSPTFVGRERGVEHITSLGRAAAAAGVRRVVYNTTSWHPDRPIGVPTMDHGFWRTEAIRATGVPVTVVRPSLFMDNLLTRWVKPFLLSRGEFSYPHDEALQVSWISLDDVARYMIAVARRDDCAGEILDIGGAEALRPGDVADKLSVAIGRRITYRRITPREFGERLYAIFADVIEVDRETYVSNLERHYVFKNETNPFLVPMHDVIERFGIAPTTMDQWLAVQDWSSTDEPIGSVSG
jgi:uncharacterized protein YbjT (DUF2867 family)